MDHSFVPNPLKPSECSVCSRISMDHSAQALCEICDSTGECDIIQNNILACKNCQDREALMADSFLEASVDTPKKIESLTLNTHCYYCNTPHASIKSKIKTHDGEGNYTEYMVCINCSHQVKTVSNKFKEIDDNIKISQDFFNSETVSIQEMKEAIDSDSSIPEDKKSFTLAKQVEERFLHYTDVLFSKRQEILELETKQRAIQIYYNDLAKSLREAERHAIRLKDASYKPNEVKTAAAKPKAVSVKKYDKMAIKSAAIKSGFPEQLIQIICVQKNMTPEEAVASLQSAS